MFVTKAITICFIVGVATIIFMLSYVLLAVYWINPDYVKRSVANIFRKCGCSRWYSYESTPADTYQRSMWVLFWFFALPVLTIHFNKSTKIIHKLLIPVSIIASQFLDDIAWVEERNNCTSMIQYDDLNNLLNDWSLVWYFLDVWLWLLKHIIHWLMMRILLHFCTC